MKDRVGNKIELEVIFGNKKAVVKLLSFSWLSDEMIIQAINHIIEKNDIKFDSIISEVNCSLLTYPTTVKLIEDEMLKNDIEIYIYYFRRVTEPDKIFRSRMRIIFYIILIALILIGLFTALLTGFVMICTT